MIHKERPACCVTVHRHAREAEVQQSIFGDDVAVEDAECGNAAFRAYPHSLVGDPVGIPADVDTFQTLHHLKDIG